MDPIITTHHNNNKSYYLLLLAIIILLALIYYITYRPLQTSLKVEELPLITRDASYIKVIPQDKGGIIFSNQDKEIYNSVAGYPSQPREEILVKESDMRTLSALVSKIQNTQNQRSLVAPPSKPPIDQKKTTIINKKSLTNVFDVLDVKEIELTQSKNADNKR